MADNVTFQTTALATLPDGTIAETIDQGGGVQRQVVQIEPGAAPIEVSGALAVGTTIVHKTATPTISTSIYAAKDAIGGLLTFTNAASSAGRPIMVSAATLVDKDQERAEIDLILFKSSITAPTDNAVFDPTDTELLEVVGIIQFNIIDYADFNDNSAAVRSGLGLDIVPDGTSLFGVLVARSTPSYTATSDLVVTLRIVQY